MVGGRRDIASRRHEEEDEGRRRLGQCQRTSGQTVDKAKHDGMKEGHTSNSAGWDGAGPQLVFPRTHPNKTNRLGRLRS